MNAKCKKCGKETDITNKLTRGGIADGFDRRDCDPFETWNYIFWKCECGFSNKTYFRVTVDFIGAPEPKRNERLPALQYYRIVKQHIKRYKALLISMGDEELWKIAMLERIPLNDVPIFLQYEIWRLESIAQQLESVILVVTEKEE